MNEPCIPGQYLCPTARRLWAEASGIDWVEEWETYEEAGARYSTHVESCRARAEDGAR